ncbi:MAG: VCBS repeat-containing protein, partial [Planctomycetes bacterium]|nr:VCBS repeat-containing protein [Planctomycetota bacterium]MBI3834138.1 VCBS repeat-containing protein [Planctomycetota bacterium]
DGDGKLDVVASNFLSSNVSVFRNNGNGTLTKTGTFSVGTNIFPWGIVCCDLNGDGHNDVITAGSAPLKILFNNGSGSFGNLATYTTGLSSPFKLDCRDLDGDGREDVVVSDLGSHDLRVFLNTGNGTLAAPFPLAVGSNPGSVACRNTDNDTDVDVVTCSSAGAIVFENNCGPPIPALSECGVLMLTIALLAVGAIIVSKRSRRMPGVTSTV